jgi:hypothetical protein
VSYKFLEKPPRWDDEEGVAAFVATVLEGVEGGFIGSFSISISKYLDTLRRELQNDRYKDWPKQREKAAVEEAKRGDLERLVEMLRPLESGAVSPEIKSIAPETWTLVVEFLTGERSLNSGRLKGEPGRPKMSKAERRARNPVHIAAVEFPAIKDILKWKYPKQTRAAIHERAAEIAAKRNGIKAETLKTHCARRRSDRRRI